MNNANEISLLERQHSTGQYMLLATPLATVVNIILLLTQADIMIPYCAAVPYYLTMLGYHFDGFTIYSYTATGLVIAAVLLLGWLLVWWMSRKRVAWMKAGFILVIVDTVFLALFAFTFLENPASCLLEGLLHIAVIYEVHVGLKAHGQLERLQREQAAPVPAPFEPWEEETPADSEYSDTIE